MAIAQLSIMQRNLVDFLLIDLRRKPGMYLTAYNLSYLDIFLTGILLATWELNKSGDYSESFFGEKGFLQWSWNKYNLGRPSYRLHHYLEFANGDEKSALDLFFEDLEKYSSEKNTKNLEAISESVNDRGFKSRYQDADKHNWTKAKLDARDYVPMQGHHDRGLVTFATEKVQKDIAVKLLTMGLSVKDVAASTGLTTEQVNELREIK